MGTLAHTASFHTAQRLSRSAQSQHSNNIGVLLMHTSSKHSCNAVAGQRCIDQCQPRPLALLLLLLLLLLHPLSGLLLCY
jgi:hypothetical protein